MYETKKRELQLSWLLKAPFSRATGQLLLRLLPAKKHTFSFFLLVLSQEISGRSMHGHELFLSNQYFIIHLHDVDRRTRRTTIACDLPWHPHSLSSVCVCSLLTTHTSTQFISFLIPPPPSHLLLTTYMRYPLWAYFGSVFRTPAKMLFWSWCRAASAVEVGRG